jgi:Prophage tail length tape measure protein
LGDNVKFDINAQNKTDKAFASVKKNLAGAEKGFGSLQKMALGIGAAAGGLYAMAKGVQVVTEAANVQREAESKLNAVLEATGHAAGFNLNQLQNMASGLQSITTTGDEAILSGMSILATFKNIKGEAFEGATMAALDMSQVMGQDLKSSMVQLGKALNDPLKGITALSRVGVSFTEEQKELIATLMEEGDVMAAQKVILEELQGEFGGAAEAAGGPFDKALKQLSNTWGDLLERIGFGITDNEVFVELLRKAEQYVASLIPRVGELINKFVEWIGPVDQLDAKIAVFKETVEMLLKPLKQAASLMNTVGAFIGTTAGRLIYGDIPSYDTGTGAAGLPSDGLYYGHKGEIILNPAESQAARSGAGGSTYHITIAPTFMSGDRSAARTVATELRTALNDLDKRWGG